MAPMIAHLLDALSSFPAHLLAQGQGAATPGKAKAVAASAGGGWLDPVNLLINVSTLMLVGIFVGAIFFIRGKLAARRPDPRAESEFERQVLSELFIPPHSTAPTLPIHLAPGASSTTPSAPALLGDEFADSATTAARLRVDPAFAAAETLSPSLSEAGDNDGAAPETRGAPFASPHASVEAAFDRLLRLRPDAIRTGVVGELGGGLEHGQGIAVAWDNRRSQAVIAPNMPEPEQLANLLRRFDAVIVAPADPHAEPIVVDRLSAFFFRGMALRDP